MNLKNARYIEITGDTVREAILHPKAHILQMETELED